MSYRNSYSFFTRVRRRCARRNGKYRLFLAAFLLIATTTYLIGSGGADWSDENNSLEEPGQPKPINQRVPLNSPFRSAIKPNTAAMLTYDNASTVPKNSLQAKLKEAELKWWKHNSIRNKLELSSLKTQEDLTNLAMDDSRMGKFWKFFEPSFQCPYKVGKIGRRSGDGGKFVCGFAELAQKPKCVVYSFGIHYEHTFEHEIVRRTNCTLHMFEWDERIKIPRWAANFPVPGRVTYTSLGIGSKHTDHHRSLKMFMDGNGDEYADILKIDIEGWEWPTLYQILIDYPDKLPFGQLQVEIHLHLFKAKDRYLALRNLWYSLEQAGLRPVYKEYNMPLFIEFSFLNIRQDLFKLDVDRNSKVMEWTWDLQYRRNFMENFLNEW